MLFRSVILEERRVLERLNELEVLIGEARGRRDRGEGRGEGDVA